MWSSPRIALSIGLLFGACNENLLAPVERPSDSGGHADSDESAWVDSGDTAPPHSGETGSAPCGPGTLTEADGRSLRRDDAAAGPGDASVPMFGYALAAGPPGTVWVQAGLNCDPDAEGNRAQWVGAYLLGGDAWASELLDPAVRPRVRCAQEDAPVWLLRGGLTTDPGSPDEATWFGTTNTVDEPVLFLFDHPPSAPADTEDSDSQVALDGADTRDIVATDLDGDGLDDLLVPGSPARIWLAPFAESSTQAEADVVLGATAAVGFTSPVDLAAADLDGDGYPDLAWRGSTREADTGAWEDIFIERGPILSATWDAADGTLLDEVVDAGVGAGSGLTTTTSVRAVGDVTGDGGADVAIVSSSDGFGAAGSQVVYVLDHLPAGTEALASLGTRLVGDAPGVSRNGSLGVGDPGDVNGDGQMDLVVFQWSTDLVSGLAYRSYVLSGPVSGEILLPDASVQIALPATAAVTDHQATIVPDLDGDGDDEVIVATMRIDTADEPGRVWEFPGCAEW